jgi:DNA-binding NtrC family response regulator
MKILVVDDETLVKKLFEKLFKEEIKNNIFDFHFEFCAEDALKWLDQNKETTILMLTDIKMAEMDGFDLLKIMKGKFPTFPVIMISAYANEANFKRAEELGANEFMEKPLDMNELKNKLLFYINEVTNKESI